MGQSQQESLSTTAIDDVYASSSNQFNKSISIASSMAGSSEAQVTNLEQHTTPRGDLDQHKNEMFAKFGIKVRDFAYESTLPPIRSVIHIPSNAGGRPWKRGRGEYEEREQPPFVLQTYPIFAGADTSLKKTKPLEREITEPVNDTPSQLPLRRQIGYNDLNELTTDPLGSQPVGHSDDANPSTPKRPFAAHIARSPGRDSNWLPSSLPALQMESQESEWIDTPLVTPNGSLQWVVKDTSAVPASQLDTESQLPVVDESLISHSQLGFMSSPEQSQPTTTTFFRPSLDDPSLYPTTSSFLPLNAHPGPSTLSQSLSSRVSPPGRRFLDVPFPQSGVPRYSLRDRKTVPPTRNISRPNSSSRACNPRPVLSQSPPPCCSLPKPSSPRPKSKQVSSGPRVLRRSVRHGRLRSDAGFLDEDPG